MTTDENIDPTEALGDLSTSPRSSILLDGCLLRDRDKNDRPRGSSESSTTTSSDYHGGSSIALHEFIDSIPSLVATYKDLPRCDDGTGPLGKPIQEVFGRVDLSLDEWGRYALLNPTKNYTRNLVATDHATYTLLVLVWTPGRSSPIHDHPCDGCWMRVLSGSIRECRYAPVTTSADEGVVRSERSLDDDGVLLECVRDEVYHEGQVLYIEDCLGYHKVENPSSTHPAVTMHLYSPPFDRCRVWHDETNAATSSKSSCVRYDSEYGVPN